MVLHETDPPLMIVEMLPITRCEHRGMKGTES
jgi:hypothetical protein